MKTTNKLRYASFTWNIAITIFLTTLIAGCGNESPQMFPIEGGYIDLRNVSSITTHGFITLWGKGLKNENGKVESYSYGEGKTTEETWALGSERGGDDPLTKASIEKAKRIIRQNKNADIDTVRMGGYISFDDKIVFLMQNAEDIEGKIELQLLCGVGTYERMSIESYKDLLDILDTWAEVLEQLPIQ